MFSGAVRTFQGAGMLLLDIFSCPSTLCSKYLFSCSTSVNVMSFLEYMPKDMSVQQCLSPR